MPIKQCVICERRVDIDPSDNKYLDRDGDFVCSKLCVYDWVENHGKDSMSPWDLAGPRRVAGKANLGRPTEQWSAPLSMWFRSLFEMYFAEDMHREGFEFQYEEIALLFETDVGTQKIYVPDFYFTKHNCFVEIKGKWEASQRSKMRAFRECFPEIELLTVTWLLEDVYYKEGRLRLV